MSTRTDDWRYFRPNASPTLGVEIELAVLDTNTLDLAPRSLEVLSALPPAVQRSNRSGAELQTNSVELRTGVCRNIAAVRHDLAATLAALQSTEARTGVRFCGFGLHPYAHWQDQRITPLPRPLHIAHELQAIGRRATVFGLHVHVGVGSGERGVAVMNALVPALPILLALAANSPFHEGHDTGLACMRRQVLASMPRTGLPQPVANWAQWSAMLQQLRASGHITGFRDLWSDVRLNPNYGTVEVRVCDMPSSLNEVVALAALVQALVVALDRGIIAPTQDLAGCGARAVCESNLWSAARHGMRANVVDFYAQNAAPVALASAAARLLDRVQPAAAELGTTQELNTLRDVIRGGSGATRQRRIYASTCDLRSVVDRLSPMIFPTAARDCALAA